jgi:hypothetical protein
MSTKLLSLEAAGNASLVVPSSIADVVVSSNVIPFVVPLIKALAATGAQIVQVVAKQCKQTDLQLSFYDAVGREIEKRIIPIIAPIEAVQMGLDGLNKRCYDPRLRDLAEKKLMKILDED